MIDKIKKLDSNKAQELLILFLDVYLEKGFGVMNKTEIETLLYHVMRNHGLLTGKCFDDSFSLQITEAKARKLIYESQIKYGSKDKEELLRHLRTSVGECLSHAYFSKNNKEIKFAIEDKYLRVALNAKLRENNFFADTSFNTDIVTLDENAFVKLVTLLVPNYQVKDVLAKVNFAESIDNLDEKDGDDFWHSLTQEIITQASVEGLKQIGQWMLHVEPKAIEAAGALALSIG